MHVVHSIKVGVNICIMTSLYSFAFRQGRIAKRG